MTKSRTSIERAAGILISSIQKEWSAQLGNVPEQDEAEVVLNRGHDLLQAKTRERIVELLKGGSVSEYLGSAWTNRHPMVGPSIAALEQEIRGNSNNSLKVDVEDGPARNSGSNRHAP